MEERRILLLCTGNSARSQMAEAIVNAQLGDQWQAVSAGTKPTGYIHPRASRHSARSGSSTTAARSRRTSTRGAAFELVVTVCNSAAEECPVWLGKGKRTHHSFPDPAKVQGTYEEVTGAFRSARDSIANEIPALLSQNAANP